MFADHLTITEDDIQKLGLELFSVPGKAVYVGDKQNPAAESLLPNQN